jgi:hypothetical protein
MIGVKLVGSWKQAQKMLAASPSTFDRALKKVVHEQAEQLAASIRKNILRNTPPPNAASTVALKGSSKTLVKSGEMANSVQISWHGKFSAIIGIPASAKKALARLADIHEHGRVIVQQMTDKQRKFLHARFPGMGSGTGTGIIVIHIPARPFIKPAFEEYNLKGKPKFLDAFTHELSAWVASGK